MKTIFEILKLTEKFLFDQKVENARRQAELIISDALNLKRVDLYTQFDRPLDENELADCREFLQRFCKGEPLQYIRGFVEFYHCHIKVNKNVLIPRQETELLVDRVVKILSKENLKDKVLLDLCTGSGCIGISLKKRFPELHVILSDISHEALEIAKENAKINGVEIETLEGDFLEPFKGRKAHFFICNPPYIREDELNNLEDSVKKEPLLALVSGPTGLEFYKRLSVELSHHLEPHAKAFFELGKGQGRGVSLFFKMPPWQKVKVEQDLSGHDRFFFLEIE